jgi:hypothetical protein
MYRTAGERNEAVCLANAAACGVEHSRLLLILNKHIRQEPNADVVFRLDLPACLPSSLFNCK